MTNRSTKVPTQPLLIAFQNPCSACDVIVSHLLRAGRPAVTFLSVTLAHVILRLRVARIGFLSATDTYISYIHMYIQTISKMRRRISCPALRRSANICLCCLHIYVQHLDYTRLCIVYTRVQTLDKHFYKPQCTAMLQQQG